MISYDHCVKIYYKDVDQMGVVYYSRYFEYFEEARTEMLAAIGLKYSEVEAQGYMMPVIEAYSKYKKGIWENPVISKRIISWILNADIILNNADNIFKEKQINN